MSELSEMSQKSSVSSVSRTTDNLIEFKKLLREYVNKVLQGKNLKIEKQKVALEIKQNEILLMNLQDQILQMMEEMNITENEINLGNNTIVQRTQHRKTKGITLHDIEEEFIRQNGNAITFNQIVSHLREERKKNAEVKPVLKLKVPNKMM